jgi:hypothetical protein
MFGYKASLVGSQQGLHRTSAFIPVDVINEVVPKALVTHPPVGDEWCSDEVI